MAYSSCAAFMVYVSMLSLDMCVIGYHLCLRCRHWRRGFFSFLFTIHLQQYMVHETTGTGLEFGVFIVDCPGVTVW